MTKTPKTTLEEVYVTGHIQAQQLIEMIGHLLSDLPASDDSQEFNWSINWSHVATVNLLNSRLTEIITSLRSEEEVRRMNRPNTHNQKEISI